MLKQIGLALSIIALPGCSVNQLTGKKELNPAVIAEAQRLASLACSVQPTASQILDMTAAATADPAIISGQAVAKAAAVAFCAYIEARRAPPPVVVPEAAPTPIAPVPVLLKPAASS